MRIIGSITLFVGIAWLAFSSCEKTIDLDYPQYEKMVIVNGYLSPGDPVKIWLNYSNSYTAEESTRYEPIKDAEVKLYEEGELLCRLPYADSVDEIGDKAMYLNRNYQPSPGKAYKLEVKVPGKELVTARTKIPMQPSFKIVQSNSPSDFIMTIKDNPNEQNFYLLRAINGYGFRNDSTVRKFSFVMETDDPVVDNGEEPITENFLLCNDKLFSGSNYNLSFKLKPTVLFFDTAYSINKFYSITHDAYLYHQSSLEQVDDDDIPFLGDFSLPISEPEPVYTNINNGMGIFAGVSGVRDTVMVVY